MAKSVSIPMPGKPVRGSRSGAPVMALLDLMGRRWALGIMWTLGKHAPLSFSALLDRCQSISPGVLNTRLKELIVAGLIESADEGYSLTRHGEQLFEIMQPLGRWAREVWANVVSDT
jgi:DNA-binding HxlR family transcriptional regulator